jgi:hypothetical protein
VVELAQASGTSDSDHPDRSIVFDTGWTAPFVVHANDLDLAAELRLGVRQKTDRSLNSSMCRVVKLSKVRHFERESARGRLQNRSAPDSLVRCEFAGESHRVMEPIFRGSD